MEIYSFLQEAPITADNSGNVYLTGVFQYSTDFAKDWGGNDIKTSDGERDIFVTRINADGSYGWTRKIGGHFDEIVKNIAMDGSGNVYLTGNFSGKVNFAADWHIGDSKTSLGPEAAFVTRINSNGSYGWTKRIGGLDYEESGGITVDGSGNLYLIGFFNGTINFAADWGANDFRTSTINGELFVMRISSSGSYGWTRKIGGLYYESIGISVDGSDNLYLNSLFESTVNFAADWGGSDSKTSAGGWDIFITRITPP